MYFLAYIGLMKHYVPDVPHNKPLERANSDCVPSPKIGSIQGQDRREPKKASLPGSSGPQLDGFSLELAMSNIHYLFDCHTFPLPF